MIDYVSELNKNIDVLKERYPFFSYINGLSSKSAEVSLLTEKLAIIVKGITKRMIPDFMKYVEENILYQSFDRGMALPSIILLQKEVDEAADHISSQWNHIVKANKNKNEDLIFDYHEMFQDISKGAWMNAKKKVSTYQLNNSNGYSTDELAKAA